MGKLKVLELFGGIGACSKALERLGVDFEIADYVEIDKYAVKSFNAIHGTNFEPQDITKWDKDIKVDLVMHGSPCQDFSVAGLGKGGDKGSGTRSSLMYETLRIVEKLKPKYVIWENVKNLLSKKHRHNFDKYVDLMEGLGYRSFYQVLNAKDYGVPQNRERVFTVSILGENKPSFNFPEKIPLETRLKDVLEEAVNQRFFLSDKQVDSFCLQTNKAIAKGNGFRFEPTDGSGVGKTVTTRAGSRNTDNFIQDVEPTNNIEMVGKIGAINGHDILKRVYSPCGLSPTLSTMGGGNTEPKIIEFSLHTMETPFIVASRGRDPKNPSDRTAGNKNLVQRLEPKFDGSTNTITTVQKDNYVVVDDSVKPSVAKNFEREKDLIVTTDKEIYQCDSDTAWQDNKVGVKVSPTLRANNNSTFALTKNLRIRKLTPKECWRLMGFDDKDFEKAEKVNSNTQLYKQAGNSIVVNVLEAILKNLL